MAEQVYPAEPYKSKDMEKVKTADESSTRLEPSYSRPLGNISDEQRLAQLGHEQQLKRSFSLPALGALCLCLMATWEALSTVIATALTSGGPPCLFYNYVLSFLCAMAIVLSLGEIASIYPTAGGQYHWVAALAPAKSRATASWATGWISLGGQIVLTASAAFASGLQAQALIVLNDDSYISKRWQGMLLYWAVLILVGAINIWAIRILPRLNLVAGIIHIGAFIGIFLVLAIMAEKNSATFVFTDFQNSSGWTNNGVSWLIGLQSAVYPILGYDAACHLAEELPHASRNVPIAMIGSVAINGLIGLAYCIMLLFSTSSLDALINTPTGFPFIQIFLDATNSRAGATVLAFMPVFMAFAATVAGVASTSRTLWAFARDKALPFHPQLSSVSSTLQIPINAIIVVTILQMLLGLIYLGNATAFNAILSMAIITLYISYIMPIFYMFFIGRKKLSKADYGSFTMPKFVAISVNVVSMIWMIVVIIFSTFPIQMPVTSQNMNYSVVVAAGWCLFGMVYYHVYGRHTYQVPYTD